jgi:TrmH family RNA methyltransferase
VIKRIASRDNASYKSLAKLASSSRARRENRTTLLDGPHLVEAFAASGGTADTVVASESGYARAEVRRLFDSAPARERLLLADRLFDGLAQVATPTGILAVVRTPDAQPPPAKPETCLLLESIQDPGNLGSILRTAVAAGVHQVFLGEGSVFAWSPKVLRAGQGAHFFLTIHEGAPLVALAERFAGTVVTTDPRAARAVFELELAAGPVAWIFGSEGAGVSSTLAAAASAQARIPMPGAAESLNVAAAVAICLFEQVRQLSIGDREQVRPKKGP